MEYLLEPLNRMHKDVDATLSTSREQAVECHNAKTHVVPYKSSVADYVIVASTQVPRTKMSTNWICPLCVSRIIFDFTVELENPLTGTTAVFHVCRIKTFADATFGTKAQMKEVAEFTDRIWQSVDKIEDILEDAAGFEVLVVWKGLATVGDSWKLLTAMFEDVPFKVRYFFKTAVSTRLYAVLALPLASRANRGGLLRYTDNGRPRGRCHAS